MKSDYKIFFIGPHSEESEGVFEVLRKAALSIDERIELSRADSRFISPALLENVQALISEADVIVADLTTLNPNVYFELGYASAKGAQAILLTQAPKKMPAMLLGRLFIEYENTENGLGYLAKHLEQALASAVEQCEEQREKQFLREEFSAPVYAEPALSQLTRSIRNAEKRIDIYVSSMVPIVENFLSAIVHSLERGRSQIRILSLDPESSQAQIRSQLLSVNTTVYRTSLRKSVFNMLDALSHIDRTRIQLRLYDTVTAYEMIRVDDELFYSVNSYLSTRRGITVQLHVRQRGVGDVFLQNFDYLWTQASDFSQLQI